MRRRIVVTGMGALSGAGANLDQARAHFAAGVCCLSPIGDPRLAHLKARYAGLLKDFDPAAVVKSLTRAHRPGPTAGDASGLAGFDKHVLMALVAAREALAAARLEPAPWGRRLGLIFSTCSGPMLRIEEHYERIIQGDSRISAAQLFAKQYHAGARVLAEILGIQGIATTVVTACTASTGAVALAADLIRCGLLDAALVGGADAFSTSTLAGFDGLKATTSGKCAPFSKPFGLNLGEAAAFVVLELLDGAQARGARVHVEVAGAGLSNDAYHCSSPEPGGRGLAAAMERALRDAGWTPESVTYLNAHGTGTEANDKAETRAIRKVFGAHAGQVPVSSTKSLVGHCLGAAGLLEVIAAVACAEQGVLPPTANFSEAREGCTLDYVPVAGRPWKGPRAFLSHNAAFGGHNASLALALPGELPAPAPDRSCADPVCLTGIGLVSSLGLGVQPLIAREACPPNVSWTARRVDEEAMAAWDRRLDLRQMDRSSRWATVATRLALREAGFAPKPSALAELGFYLSLATGPSWAESEFLTSFLQNDRRVNQVMAFPYIVPSSVAGNVCRSLLLTGHNLTLSAGPGAGLLGLGPAVAALRCGHVSALLVAAVDELTERILADRASAGWIGDEDSPPGEGAVAWLLETASHAAAREAKVLATLRGLAFATESVPGPLTPMLSPDGVEGASSSRGGESHTLGTARAGAAAPSPLEATIREALDQAGIAAMDVAVLCADGRRQLIEKTMKRIAPGWAGQTIDTAPQTGHLESAQSLFDLAVAIMGGGTASPRGGPALAVTSSACGVSGAVVLEVAGPMV